MPFRCQIVLLVLLMVVCGSVATAQTPGAAPQRGPAGQLLESLQQQREAGKQTQSSNNLRILATTAIMYSDARKALPSASIVGKDGKTKHSWRVALLPYLEAQPLYNEYHFDEPWDSEHNKKLIPKMPS